MRRLTTVLLAIVLLAACGGPSSVSTARPSGPGPGADRPAPSLPAQDAGLLQTLLSEGVDPADAQLLSFTQTTATSDARGRAKVVQRLVSGDVITFTVTVGPGGSGPAGQLHSRTTVRQHGFDVHLDYVVGPDGLTDDVRKSLDGIASADRRVASIATDARALLTAAGTGFVSVTVDWGIEEARDTARDGLIEEAIKTIAPGAESSVVNILKGGLALQESMELGAESAALLAELDQLEACARNPTNPLTKGEYAANPKLLPGILSQIEEARFDIKANTLVMDVGVLNKTLAGAGPKWLGFVVGPGTAWSKATLQALGKELVADLHNRIPKCTQDCPYTSAMSSGGTPASGGSSSSSGGSSSGGSSGSSVLACVMPQTIAGRVTYTIRDENDLVWYEGNATGLVYRWNPATGHYGLVEGRLNWSVDVNAPDRGCQGGPAHYFGSGSEPLVPDGEPVMHAGLANPVGAPDEQADIGVVWAWEGVNPTPATYYVHAIVRIHDKDPIHVEDECGAKDDQTGYFGRIYREYIWWEIPSDQRPELRDGKLAGTAKNDNTAFFGTYTWDLELKP